MNYEIDKKGGVVKRPGTQFIAELPEGYDHRTQLKPLWGALVVTHPNHPPLLISKDGKVRVLKQER